MPRRQPATPTIHRPHRPQSLAADSWLHPFRHRLAMRRQRAVELATRLAGSLEALADFAAGHEFFGLHRRADGWVLREWAPNATAVHLVGDFSGWRPHPEFRLSPQPDGVWTIALPAGRLAHGDLYRLHLQWPGGEGDRLPTHARRVVQDPHTLIFNAQAWAPPTPYQWRHASPPATSAPLIYEAHVGMAQEEPRIGTYGEFRDHVLPQVARAGYNTVQLMAIIEHPYYGSFGYHVSSLFAASSRFGTPEELKSLIDAAHGLGLRVVIDLIHSHAVRNEVEGLGRFDGSRCQFFHDGPRGLHQAWDSYCFNYAKPEVLHFLLSNCRFWLDEYRVDGFRFDGITSMLYHDHGLGAAFTAYSQYFDANVDEDALAYLALANHVVHAVRPDAVTIAEDVSGMPGLGAPLAEGGCGFDYRLAMGVTDYWFKLLDQPDEEWSMAGLWHELSNRRPDEQTISYVECHDQAIVGGQTLIFRLLGEAMYQAMHVDSQNLRVDRGMALHKMARLVTAATAGFGYLAFMGNEFGHPEWIDFPRPGNDWSYHHARRLWSLRDRQDLRYRFLAAFDQAMLALLADHHLLERPGPTLILAHDHDKLLAFERGGLFCFANFHPHQSLTDYPIEVLPGQYELVLDSDAAEFGGHARLAPRQRHLAQPEVDRGATRHLLRLYLPCRTALVLRRLPA